jgi:hypothetical protein
MRQHPCPSEVDQRSLLDRIIRTAPLNGKKTRAVLRFLFERSIRGDFTPITVKEIVSATSNGPGNENAMNAAIKRIKQYLSEYFDARRDGENREPVRVEIEPGTHLLCFPPNNKMCPLVEEFWKPYLDSVLPTRLFYPEPQFFRYSNNVYIRHLEINSPDEHSSLEKLLQAGSENPIPSHSFVPSGLVAAMATLFECFHANGAALHAERLGRAENVPAGKNNVIILATPTTSLRLINSVEREWPMYTTNKDSRTKVLRNAIMVDQQFHVDQTQEDDDSVKNYVDLVKWACLTRRIEESGRIISVLSGHSRSVQGVAEFLTSEEHLQVLEQKLQRSGFPAQFQALFAVNMTKREGELDVRETTVEDVRNQDRKVALSERGIAAKVAGK